LPRIVVKPGDGALGLRGGLGHGWRRRTAADGRKTSAEGVIGSSAALADDLALLGGDACGRVQCGIGRALGTRQEARGSSLRSTHRPSC